MKQPQSITKAELTKLLKPKKPHKYAAQRTQVDGVRFDSKREAARYSELLMLEKAGEISGLRRQVPFPLKVNGELITTYYADAVYLDKRGRRIIEDTKGVRTQVYIIKRKLMKAHGFEISEV